MVNEEEYKKVLYSLPFPSLVFELPEGIYCNIARSEIKDVNQLFLETFNFQIEDVVGKTLATVFFDVSWQELQNILDRGNPGDSCRIITMITGKRSSFDLVIFRDKVYLFLLFRDVTRDIEELEQLRYELNRYLNIIENAEDIIYETDWNGFFTYVNHKAVELMGVPEEELLGKHYLDLVDPEYRREVEEFYTTQFFQRIPYTYKEFPLVNARGERIWISQKTRAIYGDDGKITAFQSISRDITDKKRVEEQLRESEYRFRSLVENSPLPIIIHQDEKVVYINPAAVRTLGGSSEEEFLGESVWELVHPDFMQMAEERVRQIYQREKKSLPWQEVKLLCKDGRVIEVDLMGTLIEYKGKPASQVVFIDKTEKRITERLILEQKELLDSIFNQVNEGLGLVNREGIINFCNQACCQILGYEMDQLLGMNIGEILQGTGLKQISNILSEKDVSPRRVTLPLEYHSPSGTVKHLLFSISRRTTEDGGLEGGLISFIDISTQVEKEQEAKAIAETLQDFLDNANDLIQMVNKNARFDFVNKKWLDTLEYNLEEVKDLTLWDIIHKDEIKKCRKIFKEIVSGRTKENIETVFITKSGKEIIVEGSANCRSKDGKPIGTRGIFRDVTQKKQAESELRKSERRFRVLFNNIPDAIFITEVLGDKIGDILDVNPAAVEQTGYSARELKQKNIITDLVYISSITLDEIEEKLLQGQTVRFEEQKKRKDGSIYWTDVIIVPIELEDKLVALSVNRDITRQKQFEQELQESEERYRLLVESSEDAIAINQRGYFIFFNQAFARMLRYEPDELKRLHYTKIFTQQGLEILEERARLRSSGEKVPSRYETYMLTREGEEIVVEATVTIIPYKGDVATFAIMRDITEHHKLLKELEESLEKTRGLEGFIPICASCKKIRDDDQEGSPWVIPEQYISDRLPDVQFSHGICPDCMEKLYPQLSERVKKRKGK